MSYEGYSQNICQNGHKFNSGSFWNDPPLCSICKAEIAFANSVDDTNCDAYGFISDEDWNKLLISPQKIEKCNLGHEHVIVHAIYRIPTDKEVDRFRTYIVEWKDNSPVRRYILEEIT